MTPKKILVVDDMPETIEFATSIIEDMEGYAALTAVDGDEAVRKALEERPDLIILDVVMPNKDGYAALSELKQDERTAHIPVIMFSSLGELGEMVRAQAGFLNILPDHFLDKPIQPERFKELIERVLNPQKAD